MNLEKIANTFTGIVAATGITLLPYVAQAQVSIDKSQASQYSCTAVYLKKERKLAIVVDEKGKPTMQVIVKEDASENDIIDLRRNPKYACPPENFFPDTIKPYEVLDKK